MADDDEWNTFMSAAQGQSDPVADMIDNSVGVSIDV
jgi:hypothetical protein